MRYGSMVHRRSIEKIASDFAAFDLMVERGFFQRPPATSGHSKSRYGAWSAAASFTALATTALLASSVLLSGSAL